MFYILSLVGKLIRNIYFLYHLLSFLFFFLGAFVIVVAIVILTIVYEYTNFDVHCTVGFFVFVTCFVCRKFAFVGFSSLFVEKWSRAQKMSFC